MKFDRVLGTVGFVMCWAIMSALGCVSLKVEADEIDLGSEPASDFYPEDACLEMDEETGLRLDLCTNNFEVSHIVTVARHETVGAKPDPVNLLGPPIVTLQWREILNGATVVAKNKDSLNDVACNVRFLPSKSLPDNMGIVMDEPPRPFKDADLNGTNLDHIDSIQKYNLVRHNVEEWVKVIGNVGICWINGHLQEVDYIWGCADPFPARSAFVKHGVHTADFGPPPSLDEEVVLWLHEIGHNKGNPHSNTAGRVMHWQPQAAYKNLSALECGRYHIQ